MTQLDLAKAVCNSMSLPESEQIRMQATIYNILRVICKYVSHTFKNKATETNIVSDVPTLGWFVKLHENGAGSESAGAASRYRFVPSEQMQEATRIMVVKDFDLYDRNVVKK